MEIKDLRKPIIISICVFAIGFMCLIFYYIDYSEKTEQRAQNNISDEILNAQEQFNNDNNILNDITDEDLEEIQKEKENSNYLDNYYQKVEEEMSKTPNKTEDELDTLYNNTMNTIRMMVLSGRYTDAANKAREVLDENIFINGMHLSVLNSIKSIGGFESSLPEDKIMILESVYDPVIYLALFYSLPMEYQAFVLGSENFLIVTTAGTNQIELVSLDKAGPLESDAFQYFSDLANTDIYKVQINSFGTNYNVYIAGKPQYPMRITYVELTDKTEDVYSSYADYFNVWGKSDIEIYYD